MLKLKMLSDSFYKILNVSKNLLYFEEILTILKKFHFLLSFITYLILILHAICNGFKQMEFSRQRHLYKMFLSTNDNGNLVTKVKS